MMSQNRGFSFKVDQKNLIQDIINDQNNVNWEPILNGTFSKRYKIEFEELGKIGEGGAGRVFLAKQRLDRNIYAIKKVKLSSKNERENERIIREVTVISRLQSQYIVRYY